MKVTKENILQGLRELGLKRGDIVMVHSSLSSIGEVEGGAAAVIEALMAAVGPEGTIMMPYPLGGATIARAFTDRRDTVKSGHPTHSVTAWGARSREFVQGHLESPTAAGKETPFGRLIDADGYILLLGVDQDRNTTLHTVEEYADLPYLSDRTVTWTDEAGRTHTKVLKKFPGPHRNFIGMDPVFRQAGIMRIGLIGTAVTRLINARGMAEVAAEALRADPAAFLCDNPHCADCVMQRGKIHAARFSQEAFTLTAVNDAIVPGLDGLTEVLQGEGISHIEVHRIDGRMAGDLSDVDIARAGEYFAADHITVSGLRTDINQSRWDADRRWDFQRLERYLQIARRLNGRYLVAASFTTRDAEKQNARAAVIDTFAAMADRCSEYTITLLIENAPATFCSGPAECLDIIQSVGSPYLRLAFNPANFVRTGIHPFLGVPPAVRRIADLLYVSDALFTGEPQLAGRGNAEVKELISILRCRSFCGYLSLLPGIDPGPAPFRSAAAAFRHLLETM